MLLNAAFGQSPAHDSQGSLEDVPFLSAFADSQANLREIPECHVLAPTALHRPLLLSPCGQRLAQVIGDQLKEFQIVVREIRRPGPGHPTTQEAQRLPTGDQRRNHKRERRGRVRVPKILEYRFSKIRSFRAFELGISILPRPHLKLWIQKVVNTDWLLR